MNSDQSEEILQYLQIWRVKAAAASFQPMKASGPDDLKPVALQHIGDEALAKIMNFVKRSMMSSFIPKRWRQMKVVFIPKLGKDNYSVPKAYRPITSNFLLKLMERVINWFLSERVIALPLPNQHVYTRECGQRRRSRPSPILWKVLSTEGKNPSSSASTAQGLSIE